jgi:hypothetical protein
MARFDRRTKARLLLLASALVLLLLGALRPESYPLFQATILIPGAFLLVALVLLLVPLAAMGSAEQERVSWKRVVDVLEHNTIILVVLVLILAAAGIVSALHFDTMSLLERAVFLTAVAGGLAGGIWGLARDVMPREGDDPTA